MFLCELRQEAIVGLTSIMFESWNDDHRYIHSQIRQQLASLLDLQLQLLNLSHLFVLGDLLSRHFQPY